MKVFNKLMNMKFLTKKNMKSLMVIVSLLFLIMVVVQMSGYFHEGFTSISPSELQNNLGSSGEKRLILFYADWCPHCTSFKPVWEEVQTSTSSNKMLAIDVGDKSSESSQLMEEYNVSGFPTVILVENTDSGKKIEVYEGNRDKTSLETYVNQNL